MITTVRELVQRAMAAADMSDSAVTPAQWESWATQENLALAVSLARAGWTLNVKTQTITVTGSETGRFELAETPLAIVAVHEIASTDRVRAIEHNNAIDFMHQTAGGRAVGSPSEYRAYWDQDDDSVVINFYPEPAAGSQFLVSYIPHPLRLTITDLTAYATAVFPGFTLTATEAPPGGNNISLAAFDVPGQPILVSDDLTDPLNPIVVLVFDSTVDTWEDIFAAINSDSQLVQVTSSTVTGLGISITDNIPTSGGVTTASLGYSQTVSYPLGFEERVVLGMARRALAKEESDTREMLGQIAECESYIEQAVWDRVFAANTAIRNVDRDTRGWQSKIIFPPPSAWWVY